MAKLKYNAEFDTRTAPEMAGMNAHEGSQIKPKERLLLIFLFITGILVSLTVASIFFAYDNPDLDLGEPWFGDIYSPFKIIEWHFLYNETMLNQVSDAETIGISSAMPIFLILIYIRFKINNRLNVNRFLHGSARWANYNDIEKMSFIPHQLTFGDRLYNLCPWHRKKIEQGKSSGVFVGAWRDPKTKKRYYLRHDGPEHILCVAPTRSGKGVGLVNPTLLTWKNSCVITDLKGELWALTSGWRSKYADNYCIRFEPARPRISLDKEFLKSKDENFFNVSRWNPFDEIRSEGSIEYYYDIKSKTIKEKICYGERETADVQNIATLVVDPMGKGINDLDHWGKTAYALLTACIIHLRHNIPEECNFSTISKTLTGMIDTDLLRRKRQGEKIDPEEENSSDIKNLWSDMAKGLDKDGKEYRANDAVKKQGNKMLITPKDEAGSIISTANSFLALYADPVVAENTSSSDFKIKQIMNSDKPVSVYLVTEPTDKDRLAPLVNLFVSLILTLCASEMKFEAGRSIQSYKNKMLLMLDEFPSIGKLNKMEESLAFIAGYGMKAYLITQDMAQLQAKYTKDESISSNCHITICYAPTKPETAQWMSDKAGLTTITEENKSVSGTGLKANPSRSMQATQRPLITKDECTHLPMPDKDAVGNIKKAGAMLIFSAGRPTIYGEQPLYFQDEILLQRAKVPVSLDSAILFKNGKLCKYNRLSNKQEKILLKNKDKMENMIIEAKEQNKLIVEKNVKFFNDIQERNKSLKVPDEAENEPLNRFAKGKLNEHREDPF